MPIYYLVSIAQLVNVLTRLCWLPYRYVQVLTPVYLFWIRSTFHFFHCKFFEYLFGHIWYQYDVNKMFNQMIIFILIVIRSRSHVKGHKRESVCVLWVWMLFFKMNCYNCYLRPDLKKILSCLCMFICHGAVQVQREWSLLKGYATPIIYPMFFLLYLLS